jgi:sugar transferase (PEP-CTERM system associated)
MLFTLVMLAVMTAVGLYQRNLQEGYGGMLLRLSLSFLVGIVVMSVLFYFFLATFLGRGVLGIVCAISFLGVVAARRLFLRLANLEHLKRRVLVLGAGECARQIAEINREQTGFHIVGFIPMTGENEVVEQDKILHLDTSLLELVKQYRIDELVVAMRDRRGGLPVHEILDCKMNGTVVLDLLTFFERETGKVKLDTLQPSWLIFSDGFRQGSLRTFGKRLFDFIASLTLLAIAWPIMVLTALAIWIESGGRGPILYRQVRVGQNWRLFQVLKFRSMRVDAEKDGVARWATERDSRITRVGSFIRKVRIDELPQIFNVLRGDMSIVGPRPERPMFVEQLSEKVPYFSERHRVKPGITGWAQICYSYGASEEDAVEKLQYDLYYVKNYGLFLDFLILFQTAQVILFGKGR